ADHFTPDALELDRLADQIVARTERRPPELVRQQHDRRTAGGRLLAPEPPATLGWHRERLEQLGIRGRARHTPWPIARREIHLADDERSDDRKRLIEFGELPVFGRRDRALLPGRQKHELLRPWITERLQDRGVHHGKDRRVG